MKHTKAIIAAVLCIILCFGLCAPIAVHADSTVHISNMTKSDKTVYVTLSQITSGTGFLSVNGNNDECMFSTTTTITNSDSYSYDLSTVMIQLGTYRVTFSLFDTNGSLLDQRVIQMQLGSSDVSDGRTSLDNQLQRSRAVMQPYADVYADRGMNTKVAHLKQYDYVHIIYSDGVTAFVKYNILSGDGTIERCDGGDAADYVIYHPADNDIIGTGYMSMDAFRAPSLNGSVKDKQRDVIGVAFSRRGLYGLYSQQRRFLDNYLDCSAFASYCWYQVGYDFSEYGTACSGIAAWAQQNGAVLWQAQQSSTVDGDNYSTVTMRANNDVFNLLQPGDIILYDWEDNGSTGTAGRYDHAVLFIAAEANSSGDIIGLRIIHCSSANSDPASNTLATTVNTNGDYARCISMIIRPTGCEEFLGGEEVVTTSIIDTSTMDHQSITDDDGDIIDLINPCGSGTLPITCPYGPRIHPITGEPGFHHAIDIGFRAGTPIYAVADGTVTGASFGNAYGNNVTISHGGGWSTHYSHMTNYIVSPSDHVVQGQVIGYIGSTGYSTGPHLDFEIIHNGNYMNPVNYIPGPFVYY